MVSVDKSEQLDITLQLLTPRYRRWTLHFLSCRDISTVDELISELTDVTDNNEVTETELMIRLQQIDLPKLDSAGLIMYDRENGGIYLQNMSDKARELLSMTKQWENQAALEVLSDEM